MKILAAALLCALIVSGCIPGAEKGYVLGEEVKTSVGSTMTWWRPKGTINAKTWGAEQVRKELVYAGISGTTIKVSYKEFYESGGDSYARQPFYQELTYDIATDKEINYQDMRILVLSADSKRIVFKILSEPEEMSIYQKPKTK
jgi:hypothetical protein